MWDERNAIKDLRRAAEIDLSLHNSVEKKLQTFVAAIKEKKTKNFITLIYFLNIF